MNVRKVVPLVFGLGLLSILAFGQRDSGVPAKGWSTDYAKALASAKKSGKLVLIDFDATWCGPCKLYKKDVFPTAEFKKATQNVILLEVDIDQHPDIAQKFNVTGIPDMRIVAPSGKQVGAVMGFGGAAPLMRELEKAKKAIKLR